MSSQRSAIGSPTARVNFLLLAGAAVLAALQYPWIALEIHRLVSGRGGDGSGLGFVRDRYVVPGTAMFLALLVLGGLAARRRRGGAIRGVLLAGWFVLATGLVISTELYFQGEGEEKRPKGTLSAAQAVPPLAQQMTRLGVREALVIGNPSIDERPVWSPDGRYLAARVNGEWAAVEPDSLRLDRGEWHGQDPVGTVGSVNAVRPLSEKAVREWERTGRFGARSVSTRDGTRFELRQVDLGTRFVVTKGVDEKTRWTTSTENCHSLALSPDDRYVAFICEQNGVVVAVP